MIIKSLKQLTSDQFNQINSLWDSEYPINLKGRFLTLLDGVDDFNHYIIEDESGNLLGWTVYFEKENEIRFSIIVDPKTGGKGIGRMLIDQLKNDLDEFYGWVIDQEKDFKANGERYRSPLEFYVKQGFEVLSEVRIDNDVLSAVKIKWKK